MKRTLLFGFLGFCCMTVSLQADEPGKPLTTEQRQQRDAVIQKYDANKDGVLDKAELKFLNKEEKKVLARTGGVGTAKKGAKAAPAESRKNKDDSRPQKEAGKESVEKSGDRAKAPKGKK